MSYFKYATFCFERLLNNTLIFDRLGSNTFDLGMNLNGINMQGANAQWANFQGAILQGANFRGADLQKADLQRANLLGANVKGANFGTALLSGGVKLDLLYITVSIDSFTFNSFLQPDACLF